MCSDRLTGFWGAAALLRGRRSAPVPLPTSLHANTRADDMTQPDANLLLTKWLLQVDPHPVTRSGLSRLAARPPKTSPREVMLNPSGSDDNPADFFRVIHSLKLTNATF